MCCRRTATSRGHWTEYNKLAKLGKLGASSLIPYARMLMLYNLRQPAAKRNWEEVSKLLDEAEKVSPDDEQVPHLAFRDSRGPRAVDRR